MLFRMFLLLYYTCRVKVRMFTLYPCSTVTILSPESPDEVVEMESLSVIQPVVYHDKVWRIYTFFICFHPIFQIYF